MDILIIIWLHWLADFALQSDKMALRKSESLLFLGIHSIIYTLPFILYFGITHLYLGIICGILNGITHFVVDLVTSKITKYYWLNKNRYMFFVTIGFDQAIHMSVLIGLFCLLEQLELFLKTYTIL